MQNTSIRLLLQHISHVLQSKVYLTFQTSRYLKSGGKKQNKTKSLLPIWSNSQWHYWGHWQHWPQPWLLNSKKWCYKYQVISDYWYVSDTPMFNLWFTLNSQFQHDSETVTIVSCFICQIWMIAITFLHKLYKQHTVALWLRLRHTELMFGSSTTPIRDIQTLQEVSTELMLAFTHETYLGGSQKPHKASALSSRHIRTLAAYWNIFLVLVAFT